MALALAVVGGLGVGYLLWKKKKKQFVDPYKANYLYNRERKKEQYEILRRLFFFNLVLFWRVSSARNQSKKKGS